jgi:hypothetical protein
MTQKIERKFYPLQHDEWVRACNELPLAQQDVLYCLQTVLEGRGLNPINFGQRQLQEVADIEAACLPFDVTVTAQEVGA